MDLNWERNYTVTVSKKNIEEALEAINRTIAEAAKCNKELYGGYVATIYCGIAAIATDKAYLAEEFADGEVVSLLLEGKEVATLHLFEDGVFVFEVEGVEICEDDFVDYQNAGILFYEQE